MDDVIAGLERLSALRSSGALTDDEFTALKQELLASHRSGTSASDGLLQVEPVLPAMPAGLEFNTSWEPRSPLASSPIGREPLAPIGHDIPAPAVEVEITCPECGMQWELEPHEATLPVFQCEDCGFPIPTHGASPSSRPADAVWPTEDDEALLEEATRQAMDATRSATQGMPVCATCGTPYDPADYRAGASEWLCGRCGSVL
ncbi:MAG: SHOCT domain-containing protein [Coriobacteriia bacterium]|nr:SHOCT domain-containing protein [Coriobacteriia bacterium]